MHHDKSEVSVNDITDAIRCFLEGEIANDHNRRVYRNQRGTVMGNPYVVGSEEWREWRNGYAYRDMVINEPFG